MKKILLGFFVGMTMLLGSSIVTNFSFAQPSGDVSAECSRLQEQIIKYGGGQAANLPAYCSTNSIYKKITYWMYYIIGSAAVIAIMYGGYIYMTARDNEAQLKKAKSLLLWTFVGLAVALLATLIVNVVVNFVVDGTVY